MHHIVKYFPDLSKDQTDKFEKLGDIYKYWNSKINVISRKDIGSLYLHHILHSLSVGKIIHFTPGTKIIDAGTGGGFPGIPLSIMFPDAKFHLVDSIAKKVKVVSAITETLNLKNCTTEQTRFEKTGEKFDFVISRAVSKLPVFADMVSGLIRNDCSNSLDNGVLYLKGGDITEELNSLNYPYQIFNISDFFNEPYFESKKIVHVIIS